MKELRQSSLGARPSRLLCTGSERAPPARFSLGLFQRALCPSGHPLGPLMGPLGLPQKKQRALWFHLKINIFLTATWTATQLKCFVDSCTTCNKHLVVTTTIHSRWGAWSWDISCALWPVNSGENTVLIFWDFPRVGSLLHRIPRITWNTRHWKPCPHCPVPTLTLPGC